MTPALPIAVGLAPISPAQAQSATATDLVWHHAIASLGDVKYPADFKRYDYVNPDAPKGGVVRMFELGTFDNFNIVVDGLKGSLADGVRLMSETLTVRSLDEPSTAYGLLAEAAAHPDDFSYV